MVSVYVSYAWKDAEQNQLVDRLGAACKARGIDLGRDISHIGYGSSIREFMDRLAAAGHVVVVFSDRYLRSRYCLYELREIWRNGHFRARVSPIILRGTSLEPEDWAVYLEYWERKKKRLGEALNKLDREYTGPLNQVVDDYAEFRRLIADWLATVCDMNALDPDVHLNTDFAALIAGILAGKSGGSRQQAHVSRQKDEEFVARVEMEIRAILDALPSFASVLRGQAREQGLLNTSNDLAKSLAAARPEVALSDVLRPATEKALPRGSPQTIRNSDVWENAKTLLAWLSVLAVRPEWVQKREQLDSDGESTFEILVRTECGVEILSSRYRQLRPRFGPVRGFDIVGEERLDLPVVESGWDDEYAVRQIGLDIAAQLFPELKSAANPTAKPSDDEILDNLRETLGERAKHKSHHHYLLITTDDHSPLQRRDFHEMLSREFPLTVIYMRAPGPEPPFLVDKESRLITIIREFLTIPDLLAKKR